MSVHAPASRPSGRSIGAAVVGATLTLIAFAGVLAALVLAPLILVPVAVALYPALRPRAHRSPVPGPTSVGVPRHGFGAGVR